MTPAGRALRRISSWNAITAARNVGWARDTFVETSLTGVQGPDTGPVTPELAILVQDNDFATEETLDCKMTELLEAVQGSRDVLEIAFAEADATTE